MIVEKIQAVAQPLVESMGLVYWGVQFLSGEALLRVYIDSTEGVSVDDCAAVSRELSVLLDVEDIIPNKYRLEVSSPGMQRPFFSLDQFLEFVGYEVKVKLRYPFEGRRKFAGLLSQVQIDDSELGIVIDDEEYMLPYEQIEKANLVARFDD